MDNMSTILLVDDSPENITLLSGVLKEIYKVKVATNGEKALSIIEQFKPDLILLDVIMPGIDGFEVCRRIKNNNKYKDIPVIFLSAKGDEEDENRGFQVGAEDYIIKPISAPILLSRIKTHLDLKSARDMLKNKNEYLEREINERIADVLLLQDTTIVAMASLAETRDNETGGHIQRTKLYVQELAEELRSMKEFKQYLTDENINLIVKSAPLHDIGKVGIPDYVLLKPAALSTDEFEIIKTHTTIGRDAIMRAEKIVHRPQDFLRFAKEIAYSHHEKWDGSGYPQQLFQSEIPVSARLMALADVYDAIISKRVYKEAMPHSMAVKIIKEASGKQFDPKVVEAFLKREKAFENISKRFVDDEF